GIVEDTTRSMLGNIFRRVSIQQESPGHDGENSGDTKKDPRLVPFRIHKRIVTTPVGKPLRLLNCPSKLVKVMADAMRAHHRIRWDADILHRDISSNNVLFYETDDGDVQGLLIDFDHAIDLSAVKTKCHLDRSGTLPFMSITNLAKQVDLVTGLDDWESALYVFSWIGTYGFNRELAPDPAIRNKLHIRKWCEGSLDDITNTKRDNLGTANSFYSLTDQFLQKLPNVELLEELVHELRTTLFENPNLALEFRGTHLIIDGYGTDETVTNPFEKRTTKERELMDSLLQVLESFADRTKDLRLIKK
ncbi:hypothetical protein LPJ53_006404, partial [Coemansia erecta]